MEKYRIELIKIGSYNSTIDNTDTRLTREELTQYMDDWFDCDNCDKDECGLYGYSYFNCDRDDYIVQLVDNETDEIICKAY